METASTGKKIFKKILGIIKKTLLTLLVLLIVALIVSFVYDKYCDAEEWDKLQEAGYVNQVSVGSHNINVCIKGNSDADFTIVTLAGLQNTAFVVDLEPVTDNLTDKYNFAFVDRSGYGLSDDTFEQQSIEQIISDYRTALQKANVKAPYVLMAHSLGGTYASYWQQNYPDEIKAVIYLDPTQIGNIKNFEEDMKNRHANLMMHLSVICCKIGVDRFVFDPTEYILDLHSEEQRDHANLIWHRCPMTWAECSEEDNYYDNVSKTAGCISPNSIPKLYIDATAYTLPDIREKTYYEKTMATLAGKDLTDYEMMEANTDERLVEAMTSYYEQNIKTYIDKLGNVTYVNIPGDHCIYKHKPDEVTEAVGNFLATLE